MDSGDEQELVRMTRRRRRRAETRRWQLVVRRTEPWRFLDPGWCQARPDPDPRSICPPLYIGRFSDTPSGRVGYKVDIIGVPNRIRTGVAAVKGRCPRPLDDGDVIGGARWIWRP